MNRLRESFECRANDMRAEVQRAKEERERARTALHEERNATALLRRQVEELADAADAAAAAAAADAEEASNQLAEVLQKYEDFSQKLIAATSEAEDARLRLAEEKNVNAFLEGELKRVSQAPPQSQVGSSTRLFYSLN